MDHSPICRLPGELRNKIYEYVLYEPQGIPVVAIHYITIEVWPDGVRAQRSQSKLAWRDRKPAILGLPRTCRAMHLETQGMYFAINRAINFSTDWIFSPTQLGEMVRRWAAVIGPENAQRVEHFRRTIQQPDGLHAPKVRAEEIAVQQRAVKQYFNDNVEMSVAVDVPLGHRYSEYTMQSGMHIDLNNLGSAWSQIEELVAEPPMSQPYCPLQDPIRQTRWQLRMLLMFLDKRLKPLAGN